MRHAVLSLAFAFAACTTHETRPLVTVPALGDPRTAVTEWAQVERYHCARGADGAPSRCATDADCTNGRVCDASANCGCCVPPPPRLEAGVALRRQVFTACAAGRCAPPPYCAPSADGTTCTMRFDREIPLWASTYEPPAGEDALTATRRALCIRVEPHQDCMWTLELPAGEYTADAPMPTRYEDHYECGGRTCNGAMAVRASPRVGSSLTARLTVQHCGG